MNILGAKSSSVESWQRSRNQKPGEVADMLWDKDNNNTNKAACTIVVL